jgi:hypothetical protein
MLMALAPFCHTVCAASDGVVGPGDMRRTCSDGQAHSPTSPSRQKVGDCLQMDQDWGARLPKPRSRGKQRVLSTPHNRPGDHSYSACCHPSQEISACIWQDCRECAPFVSETGGVTVSPVQIESRVCDDHQAARMLEDWSHNAAPSFLSPCARAAPKTPPLYSCCARRGDLRLGSTWTCGWPWRGEEMSTLPGSQRSYGANVEQSAPTRA